MAAAISVEDLWKSYGQVQALKGISFQVQQGEVFGLLGPNGAGKTTAIEMIEGLRRIERGKVTVGGIDVGRDPQSARRAVGIQLQQAQFFDRLNLIELVRLFADLYHSDVDAYALLHRVGLLPKGMGYVKTLSGGQNRRFGIALALVNNPVALFLDEPSTGLDPRARRSLWDLVASLKQEGRTVVLTTHYIEEAEELCDRVAIMDEGRVVALDRPRTLIQQLLDTGFHKELQVLPADLEDVFLNLTGKKLAAGD